HAFLREVVLITVWVMTAQAGKWHMAWALGNLDIGIILFEAVAHFVDVFHRKAEMVEPRSYAGLALQERETDDTITQMTAIFVVVAVLIGHAVGVLLLAKEGLEEL